MLEGTYGLIDTYAGLIAGTELVIRNALIESFCTHARALIEFFEKARGAQAYADQSYRPLASLSNAKQDKIVRRLNNQISHLLDGRTANDAEKIDDAERNEMFDLIRHEIAQFKAHLRPEFSRIVIRDLQARGLSTPTSPSATGAISSTISSDTTTTSTAMGGSIWSPGDK